MSLPTPPPPETIAALVDRFAPGGAARRLAPDASTRTFVRLVDAKGSRGVAVLDPRAGRAGRQRMKAAAAVLAEAGVRVPRLLDEDDELGALLFEDLGDTLLADALPRLGAPERARIYGEAGALAARIAVTGTRLAGEAGTLSQPVLDRERLRTELALFAVQDVAGRRGIADPGLMRELGAILDRVAEKAAALPRELAHRDFHARNLLLLEDGSLGVLDFQDCLPAPRFYDLASLTRDPYVEPQQSLERAALDGWRSAGGTPSHGEDPAFCVVALQRDLKALGTYAHQIRIMGRTAFAEAIPRAERLAMRALAGLPASDRAAFEDVLRRIGFPRP